MNNYVVFVLGYDLIQKELKKRQLACDEAFDICEWITKDFGKSEEKKDLTISEYDALQNFINNTDLKKYFPLSNDEKEKLLKEYIDKHNNNTCDCNEENKELCLGGIYLNGLQSKEDIFKDWE